MFKAILNLWECCRNQEPDDPIDVLWHQAQKNVDVLSSSQKSELNRWISLASSANHTSNISQSSNQSNRFYVPVAYEAIMERNDELYTTGLFCCTALAIQTDEQNFLAHINSSTNESELYNTIAKIKSDQHCQIVIWSGKNRYFELSLYIAMKVLFDLHLLSQVEIRSILDNTDEYAEVGVNSSGFYCINKSPQPWGNINGIVVRQSTAVASDKELVTDRLQAGSAIGFSFQGLNFLALIDNGTFLSSIEQIIRSNFNISELQNSSTVQIHVWHTGNNITLFSQLTVSKLLQKLSLSSKIIDHSIGQEVGINSEGPIYNKSLRKTDEIKIAGNNMSWRPLKHFL